MHKRLCALIREIVPNRTRFRALSANLYEKLGFSFDVLNSHTWRRKLIDMTSEASSTLAFFKGFPPVRFNFVLREVRVGGARRMRVCVCAVCVACKKGGDLTLGLVFYLLAGCHGPD